MERNPAWTAALEIARALRADGHEAYIAGGAVRDDLLGRESQDVDVATSAHPDAVLARFPQSRYVGAAFGVVLVQHGGVDTEVATFRTEGPYHDGRRPSRVEFATAEEDVRRRDFTVNGLFLDPESGEIKDWVGGQEDLRAGTLRAIGRPGDRFREDHLRLLRAVRLAAQLGFTIEPATLAAVREAAPHVRKVAPERVRDELLRIVTEPRAAAGLELLRETTLLRHLLPEVDAMHGVEQDPVFHPEGDVWTHTLLLFDHVEDPSPDLALGLLLHDVGKPPTFERAPDRIRFHRHARVGAEMAEKICERLKLSNRSRDHVVGLVEHHMRFMDIRKMKPSTLKRFFRLPDFDDHLALHRADCLASNGRLENWEFAREQRERLTEDDIRPAPLLNGNDLLAMGWNPGPGLGEALRDLEELQLEGKLRTREEALSWARERGERGPGPAAPRPPV